MALRPQICFSALAFMASLLLCAFPSRGGGEASGGDRQLVVKNGCKYKVWPAALGNAGVEAVGGGGWEVEAGETTNISAPNNWSGRLWARTGCSNSGTNCVTGDCRSTTVSCSGGGPALPVTLIEFTMSTTIDFYDVSLVDGFNVAVSVEALGSTNNSKCGVASCPADLNSVCPSDLSIHSSTGDVVGCMSACEAFGAAQYCCSGPFSNPSTCGPSNYSRIFKALCPSAYSYAYDDPTSTFTCSSSPPPSYLITFCPSSSNAKTAANATTQRASASYGTPPSTSSSSSILDWTPNFSSGNKICGNQFCTCILTILSHLLLSILSTFSVT